jgi:hypothetical protein
MKRCPLTPYEHFGLKRPVTGTHLAGACGGPAQLCDIYVTPISIRPPPSYLHYSDGISPSSLTNFLSSGGDRGKGECGASAEGWRERPALAPLWIHQVLGDDDAERKARRWCPPSRNAAALFLLPDRAEAIRRLVELGLASKDGKVKD